MTILRSEFKATWSSSRYADPSFNEEFDPVGGSQLGLIAEDVAKVNPDLVACNEEGKVMSVRITVILQK
jgi:hypothetical protein